MPNEPDRNKTLAVLITELNIARRNYRSYPKGHPVIVASLNKVAEIYRALMSGEDRIVIGITSDSLVIDGVTLEKTNIVFRDFGKALFERGIGSIELIEGLTVDELNRFCIILGLNRENIQKYGGIETVWERSGIASLKIRPIRYDLFSVTEETAVTAEPTSSKNLWERFAWQYSLNEYIEAGHEFNPHLLAEAVNRYYSVNSLSFNANNPLESIGSALGKSSLNSSGQKENELDHKDLAAFADHLNPELRRQMLSLCFESTTEHLNPQVEKMLSSLSTETIMSTIQDVNDKNMSIPPVVMGLLMKLGSASPTDGDSPTLPGSGAAESFDNRLKALFREQLSEQYVPQAYQSKLDRIIMPDQISVIQNDEIINWQEALDTRLIDNSISEIILQLVMTDAGEGDNFALADNLKSMCAYFLETGDYIQLQKVIGNCIDGKLPESFRNQLREYFSQRNFVEEILSGLHTWGKSRFAQIKTVLEQIGEPCLEPILDALAEESSMSLRRFMIDRILEFGPCAGEHVMSRLSDSRWYYVRNLIVILRNLDYRPAIEKLKSLSLDPEVKIKQEAIKALLHFRDPMIERIIIQNLDSSIHEVQLEAIRLAEKSQSAEITAKLLAVVSRSGLSGSEYELKSAAVHTLGQLGQPEVLPEFGRILSSRNLLRPQLLARLKIDIVQSLEHYPANLAMAILKRLAEGKDEVAAQAGLSLDKLEKMVKKHE